MMYNRPDRILLLLSFFLLTSCSGNLSQVVLFEDDFSELPPGYLSTDLGPLTEYHYVPRAGQKGKWTISSFGKQQQYHTAWEVVADSAEQFLRQNFYAVDAHKNPVNPHFHAMIVGGDSIWHNYTVSFSFRPQEIMDKCGLAFRYQNDRCYYFFGMEGNRLMLKVIEHATAPRRPFERILASTEIQWVRGETYHGVVTLREDRIYALLNDTISLLAKDNTYAKGKIGLLSDVPADFLSVRVTALNSDKRRITRAKTRYTSQKAMRIAENPRAVLWKSMSTEGFGTGRNLRFGDLDGNGEKDVLIGQVIHHGPGQTHAELSCLTAMNLDGELLWQIGKPDPENHRIASDVPFQIHDLDGDGRKEVVYAMGFRLIIADGRTGRTLRSIPTPLSRPPENRYNRILGDCLYFCDIRGKGRDSDILIKDRSNNLWAYDEHLEPLWSIRCNTGHYPYAKDIDSDGRDEVIAGYTLIDDDGTVLWSLDEFLGDKANGIALVASGLPSDSALKAVYAAGDWGMVIANTEGTILKQQVVGHVQHPTMANLRQDLPGLEMVTVNFWGNQGTIHLYDANGEIYHSFEPGPFGSMCLPVNWTGDGTEYVLLNTNSGDGGMFNGYGQLAVAFPDDGHPDLCNAVLDLTGDARDEIITWDQDQLWIYTQSDSPRSGKVYQPIRNPLYNCSNYQFSISTPGWSE
jgi:hypothetical protein